MSDIFEYNAAMTDMHILPVLHCHFSALSDLHNCILEKEMMTQSMTGPAPEAKSCYIRTRALSTPLNFVEIICWRNNFNYLSDVWGPRPLGLANDLSANQTNLLPHHLD